MIEVELVSKVKPKLSAVWLKRAEEAANKVLSIKRPYNVSVVIIGNQRMKTLNRQYRGKNKTTDVLSFSSVIRDLPVSKEMPGTLGDIFICQDVAIKQAKEAGHSLRKEMQTLFVHGLLHLLGYRHGKAADRDKMFKLQNKIIKRIRNQ